jgi:hypothetical protein
MPLETDNSNGGYLGPNSSFCARGARYRSSRAGVSKETAVNEAERTGFEVGDIQVCLNESLVDANDGGAPRSEGEVYRRAFHFTRWSPAPLHPETPAATKLAMAYDSLST